MTHDERRSFQFKYQVSAANLLFYLLNTGLQGDGLEDEFVSPSSVRPRRDVSESLF